MSVIDQQPSPAGLVARAKGILLSPAAEWDKIDGEPATIKGLYVGYVCILAAVPVLAALIGQQIFGVGMFGVSIHPPLIQGIVLAIVTYALSLVSVFILALVIDALASSFDGQKNRLQAFKVAAYTGTAGWVAGVLNLFPPLAIIAALGGLYGLYLLYLGLPKLMKVPQEKAVGYTVVTIIVAVVLFLVVGAIGGAVAGMTAMATGGLAQNSRLSGSVNVGGAKVDLGKLQAASEQMQAAAQATQDGSGKTVQAVPGETLKVLLPEGVAGYARDSVETAAGGVAGLQGSSAKAVYAKGDDRFTLDITDLGGAAGLAGMASALSVQSSKETATGYEKVGQVNGRMTTEEYDRAAKTGKYGVLVGGRFMVQADGSASIDDLRNAVNAVDAGRLEALAKSSS